MTTTREMVEKAINYKIYSMNEPLTWSDEDGHNTLLSIDIDKENSHHIRLNGVTEDGFRATTSVFFKAAQSDCRCTAETSDMVECPKKISELINGVIKDMGKDKITEEQKKVRLMMTRVYYMVESKNRGLHKLNGTADPVLGKFVETIAGDVSPQVVSRVLYVLDAKVDDGLLLYSGIMCDVDEWSIRSITAMQTGKVIDFDPEDYKDQLDEDFWELYPI